MNFLGSKIETLKSLIAIWKIAWASINYAKSVKENMKQLEDKMVELKSREEDINSELKAEVQLGKKRKREVEVWLERVQRVTTEVDSVKQEYSERSSLPPVRLGEIVAKKIKVVTELKEKGHFSDGLLIDTHLYGGLTLPTTELVGESTKKIFEKIWEGLMNDEINMIGVYGMGGVGKTTIMTHVNNQLKQSGLFDDVIWVTVSKASNVKRLQNDIAEVVNLNLSNYRDPRRRAAKIQETLKRRKKFVLILDDMWKDFPLEDIGIPIPSAESVGKLLLTTRSFEVCRGMKCQRNIKVEFLSEEEAWNLFMDKVGRDMVLAPKVEEIARLVAKECACLPLTIVTVGRTMSGMDGIREWRNALDELRSSTTGIKKMKHKVIKRLKFSYDRLRDKKLKACFLYCALYPEDYKIPMEELIEFWIADRLIDDQRNRQAKFDEGHVILGKLLHNGILETIIDVDIECVKMHDSVRDMALEITNVRPRFLVKTGDQLITKPLNEEKWREDLERVSLMRSDIMELSYMPSCPRLSTLLLQGNSLRGGITNSFFEHMPGLRVLDLSDTKIKHLPHSISDLKNLRALRLRNCEGLTDVPSLANLTELRVLDLHRAGIEELPQGMERLVNLKRLDLSFCEWIRMLPVGLLHRLSSLEELKIPIICLSLGSNMVEERKASVEELISLTHLEILRATFSDLPAFTKYVRSENVQGLKNFGLNIGNYSEIFEKYAMVEELVAIRGNCNSLVLPNNTRQLYIKSCKDLTKLSELSCLKDVTDLKVCNLRNCPGIQCILSEEDEEVSRLLPSLEYMVLAYLDNLSAVFKGVVPSGTLSNLQKLEMRRCDHIKSLFSLGLLQYLQNLKYVEVFNCKQMEEIIAAEEEEMDGGNQNTITLPRLQKVDLWYLPKLRSIYKGLVVCDSLQFFGVNKCPELKKLPLSMEVENRRRQAPLALKEISGNREWWDSLEWDHPNDKTFLQPFFKEFILDKEAVIEFG